ncbi:MAG: metalloregulator ArsR/SmtB family transcription factor [Candidatus Gracilibacteria bacterium]|nr:metalloregulator ArsR/SmtB family transcription factor [Candidatus Gracilibacteria bacterium]MDD2908431.1 metalloregulator ArsR/SmtB family transcription factor [Candidatus Gracilibacteria bacterium]
MEKNIDLALIGDLYSLLGEPNKLNIFIMLKEKELCICEIIEKLNIKQNMVSHHVAILRRAGILNSRKDGTRVFYSINLDMYEKIKENTKILFNI